MTVSTTAFSQIVAGTGAATVFNFSFAVDDESDIQVVYTDADGVQTLLPSSAYTVFINPAATGQLYGVGGSITYNPGSPIAAGTTLTISRVVSLTQQTSISNQGAFYPQAVERALDNLCFEIQQVSGRSGADRGQWTTDVYYNFADFVIDGVNGNNTQNYYSCNIANTSGVWADDLAAGYWTLFIDVQTIAGYADAAEASATDAADSASDAADSATSAAASATAASASATTAAGYVSTVQTAAANAATSETNAAASAAAAAISAGTASTSATTATTQAATATTQATTATTQAGLAATYATAAGSSATAAAASAAQAAGQLIGTSTSSNSIGTGAKTFTTQSGLALGAGGFITVADTSSPANYLHGQVTSYSGTTLVMNVLDTGGTGTITAWTITTSAPRGPTGSGSGTVNSGTALQMTYYAGTGDTVSGNANVTVSNGALTLGQATSVQGSLVLSGSTSGTTTIAAPVAGTGTMTLQAGNDTIVGRATTDTLTNKTLAASSDVIGGVTMTLGSDAQGDIYYRSSGGVLTRLANGGANKVLHGSATVPSYSAVVEGDLGLTDITTANVTSSAHGFAPKSGGNAATFLNGAATPAFAAVKDSDLSVSDITTNNATASAHGFCPKLSGISTQYLDGTGAFSTPSGGGGGGIIQVDVYTSSGTWTKPAGCTAVEVWVVGGGGGGGGADGTSSNKSGAGGGGGGGGTAYKYITSSLGSTETVTVGAGGAGGSSTGGNGSSGGTSSFGSHCTATGGIYGTGCGSGGDSVATAYNGGYGGAGSSGTYNLDGQDGQFGWTLAVGSTAGLTVGGAGGNSSLGGGSKNQAVVATGQSGGGFDGGNYGGGGGGAVCIQQSTGIGGGDGAGGIVIVKSYS